jgi:hypothetical protein
LLLAVLALFIGVRTIVEFFSMAHAQYSIAHAQQRGDPREYYLSGVSFLLLIGAILGSAVFAPGGHPWIKGTFKFTLPRFWVACVLPWLLATCFASLLFSTPMAIGWFNSECLTDPLGLPEYWWTLVRMMVVAAIMHGVLGGLAFSCRLRGAGFGAVAGALGGVMFFLVWRSLLWAASAPIPYAPEQDISVAAVVTFGVPLSLASYVLTNFLMVGLCGPKLSEIEREWWSSVNSRLMMLAMGWMALFGIAVFGPWLVGQIWQAALTDGYWNKVLTGTAGAGWLGTLAAGLKIAHGPSSSSTSRGG